MGFKFKKNRRRIFSSGSPIKVAAIHDLSGYGKASLTIVIPVLSQEGIEVCPLPSAILSTPTCGFAGYSFCDLTKEMNEGIDHWIRMGLTMDALYTGFLGSEDQIEPVSRLIDYLSGAGGEEGDKRLIVIDPVMGDNGVLYGPYSDDFIEAMRRLIARADLITPNFTEAAFLLGEVYPGEETLSEGGSMLELAQDWSRRLLSSLHGKRGERGVVITGVPVKTKRGKSRLASVLSVANSEAMDGFVKTYCFTSSRLSVDYPGTGDYYTSCLVASVLKGNSFKCGVRDAIKRTSRQIKINIAGGRIRREGLAPEMRHQRFFR